MNTKYGKPSVLYNGAKDDQIAYCIASVQASRYSCVRSQKEFLYTRTYETILCG